jgi:hypothetical protein
MWHSGASGAFVEDTIELVAFYRDSLNEPIGAPRPLVEWASSNPAVVQVLSDSLAIALDTGRTVLRATTSTTPFDTMDVAIEVIQRWHGRLVWAHHPTFTAQAGMAVQDLPRHDRQFLDIGYPGSGSGDPYLSSDGQRLAVTARRFSSPLADNTVFVVDLANGVQSAPFDTVSGAQFAAAWLPGDTTLGFLMRVSSGYEIFTSRSDGSQRQQRTTLGQLVPPFFDITPDGTVILRLRNGSTRDLFEVSLSGGIIRQLTTTLSTEETFPSVSPDGSMVVYVAADTSDGRGHVWIMKRDGSTARRLLPDRITAVDAAPSGRTDLAQSLDPSWSPDGRFVLIAWFVDPYISADGLRYLVNGEIYAIRVADGLAIRLTRSELIDRQPVFR